MKLYNATLPLIIILLSTIHDVRCLKCYQCRSDRDKKCGDKVSARYLKECPDNPGDIETSIDEKNTTSNPETSIDEKNNTGPDEVPASVSKYKTDPLQKVCRKTSQILYVMSDDEVTIRDCGYHYNREICSKTTTRLYYLKVCDCTTDGCNSSDRSSTSLGTIVLMFTGAFVASTNLLLKYLWNTKISL